MIGVHLVDRRAGDRPGQPELTARRHDAVADRNDHRGRDIDLADPAVRAELADGFDGRDGGDEPGPAQLGAGPAGGRRVVDVTQERHSGYLRTHQLQQRVPPQGGGRRRQREGGQPLRG